MVRKARKREITGQEVTNAAVQEGVDAILERHPRFKGMEDYIVRHISPRKLNHALTEINNYIEEQEQERGELPDEKKAEIVYKNLANYVAAGEAFDEAGQEVILKGSLEEKAKSWWSGGFARRVLKSEKYLDEVMGAFSDLYSLLKSGDYSSRMPELAEAVTTVYDMGFLDAAVDVLEHYKLIDNKRYTMLKDSIRKRTEESGERAKKGVEKYVTARRAAASVVGIAGIGVLVVSGLNMTAGVIGAGFNNSTGIISGLLLLIASFLLLKKK